MKKSHRWEKYYKFEERYCCPKCSSSDISFQGMSCKAKCVYDRNELWWCNNCKYKELHEIRFEFDNFDKSISNANIVEKWTEY